MNIFSSGGGVQSTAALVLAAQGKIDYPVFVFANTGDDSEHPDTLDYVRDVSVPFAKKNGIEFMIRQKRRLGKHEHQTLLGEIYRRKRSVPIPARMSNGAPGNRTCTVDFKIRIIDKFIAEELNHGGRSVVVGLGISTDEIHRAKIREPVKTRGFIKSIEYPLIDLSLNRSQCQQIIINAGLPPAPKSACYFCPFHSKDEWVRLRHDRPDLFQKAVELERFINHKREAVLPKDKIWLHRSLRPLDEAVGLQRTFDDLENCEDGYCFT
ncbi:hypothetical protein LCGC14_2920280 [marine sediment metagenome]|uniref:Phosphoadenosine phosphosulphate reductase domain-containing protein n=1 Tax=marine sediment metagenome TaxID=412755 RepID=A0A0F9AF12_9ZZZZ